MNRRQLLGNAGIIGFGTMLMSFLPKSAVAMALRASDIPENREKEAAKTRINLALSNPDLKDKISVSYANSLLDSVNFETYVQFIVSHQVVAKSIESLYAIPACVSMAQALNESNAWLSELAKNQNNYFGLTCKEEHEHSKFWCKFKNDQGTKQYFKTFAWKDIDISWHSYADRLKNKSWKKKGGGKHMVYGKCFTQTCLRGRCKALDEIYAHSTTYATSLFTLIVLFNLQEFLGVTMPLTDRVTVQDNSDQTIQDPASDVAQEEEWGDMQTQWEDPQGDGVETVVYMQHIKWPNLFRAVQNAYAEDIVTYNIRAKLQGDKILTVKKVCDYITKNFPASAGYGKDATGWLLPLDFTILWIPLGSF